MRFVVVTHKLATRVACIVDETGATDVTVLTALDREMEPAGKTLTALTSALGSDVLGIQLDRKYARALQALAGEFDAQKQLSEPRLRDWIARGEVPASGVPVPSAAFVAACTAEPRLLLARGALDRVDAIPTHRHAFMANGANALGALAGTSRTLGMTREKWFEQRKLTLAQSGNVRYRLHATSILPGGLAPPNGHAELHLKVGDNTTEIAAARIYFDVIAGASGVHVVVFHAGPHVPAGTYERHL